MLSRNKRHPSNFFARHIRSKDTMQEYNAVPGTELSDEDLDSTDDHDEELFLPVPRQKPLTFCTYVASITVSLLAVLLLAGLISLFVYPASGPETSAQGQNSSCPQRHEWRNLTTHEQQDYIKAVLCLQELYSKEDPQDLEATAYDDFAWVYSQSGDATRNSAPFLPWHRYYLTLYENTLRERCAYMGRLAYWDWTLDYAALENSSIFSPTSIGFGGDGEQNGTVTVGSTGRCVIDGPFADTEVNFYDTGDEPHCLSRGFRNANGTIGGPVTLSSLNTDSVEQILGLQDFEVFSNALQTQLHDAISFSIGGDFETFTAPYDPVFFLHLAQLDRLWWIWQQRQPYKGIKSYGGHRQGQEIGMAGLRDELKYHLLAGPIKVRDVMKVDGKLLCYRY